MQRLPSLAAMTRAVDKRSSSYDGVFFVAVRTTGIFCRPSCPSRKALPQNRQFFSSIREALFAGYRPCKRCRPLDVNGKPPEWVERLLAELELDPSVRGAMPICASGTSIRLGHAGISCTITG